MAPGLIVVYVEQLRRKVVAAEGLWRLLVCVEGMIILKKERGWVQDGKTLLKGPCHRFRTDVALT